VAIADGEHAHTAREGARPARRVKRLATGVVVLGLAGLVALAAAEAALRALAPDARRFCVWPPGLERTFHPDPALMPGIDGTSEFRISSLGLRAREAAPAGAASPRVLAVGGSTTECLYLDQAEAWPALVERGLGSTAWVGNAGVSGRHTRDHVVQLVHLLPEIGALDRIVLLVGVNDLMLVLGQGDAYDPRGLDAPGERERALRRAFAVLPRTLDPARFPRGTELWRRVLVPLKDRLVPAQAQDDTGAIYATWRAHRAGASRWIDALPDLAPALAEYERTVRELARLARAAGARPLFVTQPCLWSAAPPPAHEALFGMGGVGDYQKVEGAPYDTARALALGMARDNARLLAVCTEIGADCLDLAALMPPDGEAFYDDVHFNEEGARRVAAAVTEALGP
jgi:lysophospholipase L1-like esterase